MHKRLSGLLSALFLAALTLSLASCDKGPKGSNEILIQAPYVLEVPPAQTSSAAFMTIQNKGATDDALISADSDVAGTVELHEMAMVDEMMKMRKIERIDIPAGKSTELKRGGLHVMLINLKRELKAGEIVKITLNFEKAGAIHIEAPIQKGDGMMEGMDHGMNHGEH